MSSSTVDFKSGWVPAIGGEELAPCKLIERIVQDCLLPSPLVPKDRPWTRVVLNSHLNRHLESKEAVWEAIVALWRLKSVQEDGVFAASWHQHVLAWISRYLSIVKATDRDTLDVLKDWIGGMISTGTFQMVATLDASIIEVFKPSSSNTEQLEVHESDEDELMGNATPTPPSRPKPLRKPARVTSDMDVDDEDLLGQPTTILSKSTVRLQPSVLVPERSIGIKTGFPTSRRPPKRSRDSDTAANTKRTRIERKEPEYEDSEGEEDKEKHPDLLREPLAEKMRAFERREEIVNLRGVRVNAKSRVRLADVPGLLSKKCTYCASAKTHRKRRCIPLWDVWSGKATIRCVICIVGRQNCDLFDMDINLARVPSVIELSKEDDLARTKSFKPKSTVEDASKSAPSVESGVGVFTRGSRGMIKPSKTVDLGYMDLTVVEASSRKPTKRLRTALQAPDIDIQSVSEGSLKETKAPSGHPELGSSSFVSLQGPSKNSPHIEPSGESGLTETLFFPSLTDYEFDPTGPPPSQALADTAVARLYHLKAREETYLNPIALMIQNRATAIDRMIEQWKEESADFEARRQEKARRLHREAVSRIGN